MASDGKVPPCFNGNKSYDMWVTEVEFWGELTKIPKTQQGIAVALSLPEGSSAREKVFSELTLTDLRTEDGLKILLEFLKKHFQEDGISGIYTQYAKFDDFKRDKGNPMEKYIDEFDVLQKKMKKIKVQYPDSILALRLLHRSGISAAEKKLVLTGVDYSKENTLYDQMKKSLKKFFSDHDVCTNDTKAIAVKSEPVLWTSDVRVSGSQDLMRSEDSAINKEAEVYFTNGGMARRGSRRIFHGRPQRPFQASMGRGWMPESRDRWQDKTQRIPNPLDAYGRTKLCRICASKFHFARHCPGNEHVYKIDGDENREF